MTEQTQVTKTEFKFPTETVELPSKGLLYPEDNPLHSGQIEMKYMTAREEDILTNPNYLKQGTAIDKLLKSLIVTPINYDDLLLGDKNAILIAARILGYGSDYTFEYNDIDGEKTEYTIDLTEIQEKEVDYSTYTKGLNEFRFDLPHSGNVVTFKILTFKDEKNINDEVKSLKKIDKNASYLNTTRLKHCITSVNGNREVKTIRDFVDSALLSRDSLALREYMDRVSPDMDFTFAIERGDNFEKVPIPLTVNFFWPKS
jgi:hypothetical protein